MMKLMVLFCLLFLTDATRFPLNDEETCRELRMRIMSESGRATSVKFPQGKVGEMTNSAEKCPDTGLPLAAVPCVRLQRWAAYNTFAIKKYKCEKTSIGKVTVKTTRANPTSSSTASAKTISQTAPSRSGDGDFVEGSQVDEILNQLRLLLLRNSSLFAEEVEEYALKINKLINLLKSEAQFDEIAQESKRNESVETILEVLDKIVKSTILNGSTSLKITSSNLILDIRDVIQPKNGSGDEGTPLAFAEDGVSFLLPLKNNLRNKFRNRQVAVRVGFILHKNNFLFQSSSFYANQIISASIREIKENSELKEKLTFKMNSSSAEHHKGTKSFSCGYWDFVKGDWSQFGCHLVEKSDDIICECNHLTNFAVLVDLRQRETHPPAHNASDRSRHSLLDRHAIDLVSDVGCVLSVVGLTLTVIIHLSFRSLRKRKPYKVLTNLSISLLFAYTTFLCSASALHHFGFCATIASLQHYFWLCAWFWMAIEGYTMFSLLVKVMVPRATDNYMVNASLIAYGVPAVMVAITTGFSLMHVDVKGSKNLIAPPSGLLDRNKQINGNFSISSRERFLKNETAQPAGLWSSYVDLRVCWLQGLPLYFGFLLPVGIILLYNFVCFAFVLHGITVKRRKIVAKTSKRRRAHQHLTNIITLTVLLGLAWTIGFLAILSNNQIYRDVIRWLYVIFNSTQGVVIFLLFCVRHGSVRRLWINTIRDYIPCCQLPSRRPSLPMIFLSGKRPLRCNEGIRRGANRTRSYSTVLMSTQQKDRYRFYGSMHARLANPAYKRRCSAPAFISNTKTKKFLKF